MVPLLIAGGTLLGTAGNILIGKFIHSRGKKSGYKEGKNAAKQKSAAEINALKKKLAELQQQREETKNGFREVIKDIDEVEITDARFFSKIASLLKGYTNFHLFVITCISYCRYQILKLNITGDDAEDLKTITLGLVQAGFPDKLKNDVNAIWQCLDRNQVITTFHKYKGKLDKNLQLKLDDTTFKLNEYLHGFAKYSLQVHEFEELIKAS
jgi:hypothetical protein